MRFPRAMLAHWRTKFFEHVERDDLPERLTRHSVVFALKNKKKHCFDLKKQQNGALDLRRPRQKNREQQAASESDVRSAPAQRENQTTQRVGSQKEQDETCDENTTGAAAWSSYQSEQIHPRQEARGAAGPTRSSTPDGAAAQRDAANDTSRGRETSRHEFD